MQESIALQPVESSSMRPRLRRSPSPTADFKMKPTWNADRMKKRTKKGEKKIEREEE